MFVSFSNEKQSFGLFFFECLFLVVIQYVIYKRGSYYTVRILFLPLCTILTESAYREGDIGYGIKNICSFYNYTGLRKYILT